MQWDSLEAAGVYGQSCEDLRSADKALERAPELLDEVDLPGVALSIAVPAATTPWVLP